MKRYLLTGITIFISIILIFIGVFHNQPNDVLTKAIRICLECVGIG